jgi:hypothetical protein
VTDELIQRFLILIAKFNSVIYHLVNYINTDADTCDHNGEIGELASSQWVVESTDDAVEKTRKLETVARIKNTETKNYNLAVNTRKQYLVQLNKYQVT